MSQWSPYLLPEFDFAAFPRDARVLDVGCGEGEQLDVLRERGCHPVGVDLSSASLQRCRRQGGRVARAVAEALPVATASCDGLICKVVLPYTDERRAVAEMARVLRPGGMARISGHGSGYFLWYVVHGERLAFRAYGLRALLNTMVYRLFGRRLPGFVGDTIAQSGRSLRRAYDAAGLALQEEVPSPRFLGCPVFIYHVVSRGITRG